MVDESYISYKNAREYPLSIIREQNDYLILGGNKFITLGMAQPAVLRILCA
jgi:hypothetical protein